PPAPPRARAPPPAPPPAAARTPEKHRAARARPHIRPSPTAPKPAPGRRCGGGAKGGRFYSACRVQYSVKLPKYAPLLLPASPGSFQLLAQKHLRAREHEQILILEAAIFRHEPAFVLGERRIERHRS